MIESKERELKLWGEIWSNGVKKTWPESINRNELALDISKIIIGILYEHWHPSSQSHVPWHWLFFFLAPKVSACIFWAPRNKKPWFPEVALVDLSPNGRQCLWDSYLLIMILLDVLWNNIINAIAKLYHFIARPSYLNSQLTDNAYMQTKILWSKHI